MPLIAEDPNLAVIPDFRTEEHTAAWAHLTNDTIDDDQAAELLANLWTIQNQADRPCWATRLEEERCTAEANRRLIADEEAEHHWITLEEQEAALTEERKKNKSKYAPMKLGNYCKLFYFTNNGLKEAALSSFSADSDAFIMMTSADGSHKWIPAGATCDPKAQVLKDKN
ncbi:hypothetical protein BDR07DRAFT_1291147 [Suillus spraguei]|nr:hypothetical protein BDR07DRAFT_1291147 [Suillus spraguei]